MTTYVDASIVLRVVLGEKNPLAEWQAIEPVSSELIRVECLRTLERSSLEARGSADEVAARRGSALRILDAFDLTAISASVLERASDPFPISVATLDAIHLATALLLRQEHPDLDLATHDARLAVAARAMGFTVLGA